MNKVTNLINFYNRPTKDIVKDLTNSYTDYPFSWIYRNKKNNEYCNRYWK